MVLPFPLMNRSLTTQKSRIAVEHPINKLQRINTHRCRKLWRGARCGDLSLSQSIARPDCWRSASSSDLHATVIWPSWHIRHVSLRKIIKLKRKNSDVVIAIRKFINSNNWSNAWISFLAHGCVQHILGKKWSCLPSLRLRQSWLLHKWSWT